MCVDPHGARTWRPSDARDPHAWLAWLRSQQRHGLLPAGDLSAPPGWVAPPAWQASGRLARAEGHAHDRVTGLPLVLELAALGLRVGLVLPEAATATATYLALRPVSRAQFEQLCGPATGYYAAPTRPVVNVSAIQAEAFLALLRGRLAGTLPAGARLALPSEPEWERATQAPGPEAWGFHALASAPWEWCRALEGASPSPRRHPPRPLRGGGQTPDEVLILDEDDSAGDVGFRVALVLARP